MRRPHVKSFRLAAMIAASAAVAACGLSSESSNPVLAGPSGKPITIGISLPLYGPQAAGGFAPDGQATRRGYELWASDVNSHGGLLGRPVKLIILNDKGDPPTDAKNYETLITQDHVDLTLAPFSSLLTGQAAAKTTEQHGYVLAAGSAAAPTVYALHDHYLFSTNVPVKQQMVPFANWVSNLPQGQRPASAAYPYVNNPFAQPPVQAAQHAGARLKPLRGLDILPEQPVAQTAVQRAEPPGEPQGQRDQQQADHGAEDRHGDGQAGREQHYDDSEAEHACQPAYAAVQQLTTSLAGERGTKDDARYPPELLFHSSIVLRFTRRGGPAPSRPRPARGPRTRTARRARRPRAGCAPPA